MGLTWYLLGHHKPEIQLKEKQDAMASGVKNLAQSAEHLKSVGAGEREEDDTEWQEGLRDIECEMGSELPSCGKS
ncbi:unnamed protein product [Acanthoscelides obtectus]|uniref:Uncharacterized protein n=1 Tax=Acanthoscelides obtectus TaxID=200917 RepID=A0A9P0KJK4_ACAOB|nr:unnamed protein product [Acanthoscelides obtectus]CAK1674863.1 hypothetical protein AOBTE_LOCUS29783 [Acanthoscelides obtectus]